MLQRCKAYAWLAFFPGHRTQERAKISILIFVALSLSEIFYSSRLFEGRLVSIK